MESVQLTFYSSVNLSFNYQYCVIAILQQYPDVWTHILLIFSLSPVFVSILLLPPFSVNSQHSSFLYLPYRIFLHVTDFTFFLSVFSLQIFQPLQTSPFYEITVFYSQIHIFICQKLVLFCTFIFPVSKTLQFSFVSSSFKIRGSIHIFYWYLKWFSYIHTKFCIFKI